MEPQKLRQLLIVFISSLIIPKYYGVTHDLLNTICSQTQNQEICVRILETDSRTGFADLSELSLISLNMSIQQASKNYKVFVNLRDKTTGFGLKNSYQNCVKNYGLIAEKLIDAYKLSKQQRYKEIYQLGESLNLTYKCENGIPFEKGTAGIDEDMILSCETSASVISYIVNSTFS